MGAGASSSGTLALDGHDLAPLAGRKSLPYDHAFWQRLPAIRFAMDAGEVSRDVVAAQVDAICSRLLLHNLETRNLNVLLGILCERLGMAIAAPDQPVPPTTTNVVFLARVFLKHFIENLSFDQLVEQLEPSATANDRVVAIAIVPEHSQSSSHLPLPQRIMTVVVNATSRIVLNEESRDLHLELLYTLQVLFACQMYSIDGQNLFLDAWATISNVHAVPLCQTLLERYTKRDLLAVSTFSPPSSRSASNSWWRSITSSVASVFLWPFQIYRMLFVKKQGHSLSDNAAFLMLILAYQDDYTEHHAVHVALGALRDSDDDTQADAARSEQVPFISFDMLFEALVESLFNKNEIDWAILLLFTVIHRNSSFREFLYSKSDVDVVVIPLLETLYTETRLESRRVYMILVILLMLTNDDSFSDNAHRRLLISNVPWFHEFRLHDISLGSLMMVVFLRTMQQNLVSLRDSYLHANCLASLCNLAPHATYIHDHTAQRLVNLLSGLSRRYQRMNARLKEDPSLVYINADGSNPSEISVDDNAVEDLATFGEFNRVLMEIICSCLGPRNLVENMPLLYCLMHDVGVLEPFHHDPNFSVVAEYLWLLVHHFIDRLSSRHLPDDCSVATVQKVLRFEARSYQPPAALALPTITKFGFDEIPDAGEFFLPYCWEIVLRSSTIHFNRDRIVLFDPDDRDLLHELEPDAIHHHVPPLKSPLPQHQPSSQQGAELV